MLKVWSFTTLSVHRGPAGAAIPIVGECEKSEAGLLEPRKQKPLHAVSLSPGVRCLNSARRAGM